jgi:hypothetical protein
MLCRLFLMKKRGGVLAIIGAVFLILIVVLLIAGIYFYNFYVFKTLRVCVGEAVDTTVSCGTTQDCFDLVKELGVSFEFRDTPELINNKLDEILDMAVYCDGSCFIREVRGFDYKSGEFEMIESCREGETEIVAEIHGKDAWEIYNWAKSLKD